MSPGASDEPARRRRAVLAGHAGDEATARSLAADRAPTVRAAALGALARCGALDARTLEAAVADPSPLVRARAAELLAAVPSAGSAGLLVALLRDADPGVVEPAAFAAGERYGTDEPEQRDGPPGAPADAPPQVLADELRRVATAHDDLLCRESAVAALAAWARPEDLDVVLSATTGKPALRRRGAVALAAHLDDERAVARLRELAGDRDWQVREVAEILLDGLD